MTRLFIIGNGFDLAHGLNTTPKRFTEMLDQEVLTAPDGQAMNWDDFRFEYANEWNTWESGLESIDIARIDKDYPDGPDDLSDSEEYRQGVEDRMREFTSGVISGIYNTLGRLVEEAKSEVASKLATEDEEPDPILGPKAQFLHHGDVVANFNYTDTVTLLCPAAVTMIHIHGCASAGEPLIFGYNADPDLEDERARRKISYLPEPHSDDPDPYPDIDPYVHKRLVALDDLISDLKKRMQVDVLRNHPQGLNICDVYVLGHSLSDTDKQYFEMIEETCHPTTWHVSQHGAQPEATTLGTYTFSDRAETGEMELLMLAASQR